MKVRSSNLSETRKGRSPFFSLGDMITLKSPQMHHGWSRGLSTKSACHNPRRSSNVHLACTKENRKERGSHGWWTFKEICCWEFPAIEHTNGKLYKTQTSADKLATAASNDNFKRMLSIFATSSFGSQIATSWTLCNWIRFFNRLKFGGLEIPLMFQNMLLIMGKNLESVFGGCWSGT